MCRVQTMKLCSASPNWLAASSRDDIHPGPLLAYVTEGEFWYLVDGQPEKIYKVGESFQLPHSAIHNEGSAGSNPVKVMVVFIVEKGKPLVQPAQ